MSPIPEQFSAASSKQIEAQLQLFQQFTSQAVAATAKIASLNIQTARASLEHSTQAMAQVMSARDPRDLLSLTTQSQIGFDSLLAYGRALFGIATGTAAVAASTKPAPVPARVAPKAPALLVEQPPEPIVQAEVATFPIPDQASPVKAKPLARAVAKTTPKAKPAKPAAAPVTASASKPVKASALQAVDASPSPQLDVAAPKSKKKK